MTNPREMYAAACGVVLPSYRLGIEHERTCLQCKEIEATEEYDDRMGEDEDYGKGDGDAL